MTDTVRTTDTITVATWEEITEGRRDTNTFDFIETQLRPHCERVGIYDVVRRYPQEVAACLPEHLDFVDNRFVAPVHAAVDPAGDREAIVAAIREADARHHRIVESWLS